MTAPTTTDVAAAINGLQSAANELRNAADSVSGAIQTALSQVEEAAASLDFDVEDFDDASYDLRQLADQVARLHYDEHEGALRYCTREACRTAFVAGTDVVA